MTQDFYTRNKDEINFKQIILGHYKKILEISTQEFTGGYYKSGKGPDGIPEYIPDKRKEFVQAVETLALAMFPHFDEEMKKQYQEYLKSDGHLKGIYAQSDGFIRNSSDNPKNKLKHSIRKTELAMDLFRDLSSLLARMDYFKGTVYSEQEIDADFTDIDSPKKED